MAIGRPTNALAKSALQPPEPRVTPPDGKPFEFYVIWNQVVGDFPHEYFIASDAPLLEQYVDVCLNIKAMAKRLEGEGPVVMTKAGPKTNPVSSILNMLRKEQRSYARMLRVGPSTRATADRAKTHVDKVSTAAAKPAPSSVVPIAGVGRR